MKYIAYVRRSNEDRKKQVQSIDKQIEWVEGEAQRRSLTIEKTFKDTQSGHKLGRPSFNAMMQYISESKEPIGILCWKINRLARNPMDEGTIKYAFMDKNIPLKHIIAGDREYDENANHIIMGVDFGQATQFSVDLSKDVNEGMMKKVNKGWAPYMAPYGYLNDPYALQGEREIHVDPKYFEPLQRFMKLYLTGAYSVPELQKKMDEDWGVRSKLGRPFANSSLYQFLRNKFYCGYFYWQGEYHKGAHKPMITLEEYEAIIARLDGKVSATPTQNKGCNHFSGFIQCKCCGSMITGYSKSKHIKKTNETRKYNYLKCTKAKNKECPQPQSNRNDIDKQMQNILETIQLPEGVLGFMLKRIEQENKEQEKHSQKDREVIIKRFYAVEEEMDTLGRKLSKGVIDDNAYKRICKELQDEYNRIEVSLENYKKKRVNWLEKMRETFEFCDKAPQKYAKGDLEIRKLILRNAGSNFFLNGDKLEVELDPALLIVQRNIKRITNAPRRIELIKSLSDKDLISVSEDGFLEWYPR